MVADPLDDWERLADLHARARAATPEERERLLAEVREQSPSLHAELAAMLEPASGDELRIEARLSREESPTLTAGDRVGAWRIERFLARGGMGEVYLAHRADEEVTQAAAIKLLRAGLASAELLDRFRLERNLLARLNHPAVVPLLDAGTSAGGRPFLAMRYVEGLPITRYCEATAATPRRRAELFVALCRAVQFAHQNLVVHRDLKPSNVLVTADGQVHLLDFGIAKLLGSDVEHEPTRALELAPMTPERAAPEQLKGEPVTTATDVWALGLLFHELLTGALPKREKGAPPTVTSTPGNRLERDLAAILGRATALEPERRYASAAELGDDVERWLAGEPVRARPDALGYRLRRFIGRHRVAVASATAAGLALVILSLVSVARSREAALQRGRAAEEAERSTAVVDLVVDLFGGLDPIAGAGMDTVRIADLIALGEEKADALVDQPEVQARLRHVLGRIQLERGTWPSARELLRTALDAELARLPADDPSAAPLQLDYARALHSTGDRAGARREVEAALTRVRASPTPDPELLARALGEAGALTGGTEGEKQVEEALTILAHTPGADPLDSAALATSLAWFRRMQGDLDGARARFREALAIVRTRRGESHPHTLSLRSNLASLLEDPEARADEQRQILAIRRAKLGERHYTVGNSWSVLGATLAELGRDDEALQAFAAAQSIWEETDGRGNAQATMALRQRARTLDHLRRTREADVAWRELASDLELGRLDPRTNAAYRIELALRELGAGRLASADATAERALQDLAGTPEPAPRTLARAQAAKGRTLTALGRGDAARPLLDAALAAWSTRGPEDPAELDGARTARELLENPSVSRGLATPAGSRAGAASTGS